MVGCIQYQFIDYKSPKILYLNEHLVMHWLLQERLREEQIGIVVDHGFAPPS